MDQYKVNPDDGDDTDEEPPEIPDDGDEEEEMNYYGDTQITLTQPAISRPYDRSDHFTRLNIDFGLVVYPGRPRRGSKQRV
ncbi:hypothetical protein AHAS_Ahas16G0147500 [Arachis hypogaea]